MTSLTAPPVDLGADSSLLNELWAVWEAKRQRNLERSVYFDGEAALKDFGISLPPQMKTIGAALGWPAKGVHAVTDRSQFEGFVSRDGSDDPFQLGRILAENRFEIEFAAATVNSAVHGCSFLTVTQGDVQSGEPSELILPRSAEDSAALWDKRRRMLRGFMSIVDTDEAEQPTAVVVYTPLNVHTVTKVKSTGRWAVQSVANPIRRVPVVPVVYGYELRRPLGHSRITTASMYYTDAALRTISRAEVSAEFYSAPEYWLFGADVSAFKGSDKWSAVMGRIKALEVDPDDPKNPVLHRFNGASPQPHTDQLRMWAALFADDQDLEVKFADSVNPSSADAIFAAKETLITTTKDANRLWGSAAVGAMQLAVMLRDGLTDVPEAMYSLRAQFTDPAIVSPSARADAFSKLATNIEGFGSSTVGMEYAGLTQEQIVRFVNEKRRAEAGSRLTQLVEAARGLRNGDSGSGGGVSGGDDLAGASGAA